MSVQKEMGAIGVIRVANMRPTKFKFKELIYIGILFKSNRSTVEIENWENEIKNHQPIETNFEHFVINKKKWFSEAKIFIFPTQTFGQTKIELYLNEHAIFGTGFTIEIYHRTGKVRRTINNTDIITTSLGGMITIKIQWQIIENESSPEITFQSEN